MFKPKIILNFLKRQGLNLYFLAVGVFCLFNIFTNLDESLTVVTNSLALILVIYYFYQFGKENIRKIKKFILNIKWPFSIKTKKILTNVLNYIYEKRWEITSYLFLLLLLIIVLGNFTYLERFINLSWIKKHQTILTILAIASGGLTFWHNRERVEKKIKKEKDAEDKAEEKRKAEFAEKFPRINKIPVLRSLVKWIYKEGWGYGVTIILLTITGFVIRLYKLGNLGLWWDELITGTYVTRILETGTPLFPSGLGYYWRGVAYHYFVSFFALLFENSEFWIRFPSVLFGMGIVLMAFYFTKKYFNKNVALIVLVFLIFSTYNIEYSRFARFYVMNAFLFMVAINFFWKGFFQNKFKFKILSIITLFIMIHTVQFGMIFMSLWAVWFLYTLREFIVQKNFLRVIKAKVNDFVFLIISIGICFVGNVPERLFKIETTLRKAIEVTDVTPPPSWKYFQLPHWDLITFFNQNYFPIILTLFSLLLSFFIFFHNINQTKKIAFFSFLGLLTTASIITYEIGNRDVTGARIYFFAEPLILILAVAGVYIFFKILNKKIALPSTFILFSFLLINIHPNFYERITMKYGDNVSKDSFRTTDVAAYRSDYKTTANFIKNNIQKGDILISVININYFDINRTPDYILNQNLRWNSGALVDENNNFILPDMGSVLLNDPGQINDIINLNKEKRVWLLVNGGSVNILHGTHIKQNFTDFLIKNIDNVIYESPDGWSKVLLFG